MNPNKKKSLIIVFALVLFIGFVTVGCKQTIKNSWVNTSSMPGKTFNRSAKLGGSTVISLGSDKTAKNADFGPGDVNFDFRVLK